MGSIKLLDCTLRDGGYVNNWNFGEVPIENIKTELERSKVDIIELGFLRDEEGNHDRTVFNCIGDVKRLIGEKVPSVQYAVMAEIANPFPLEKLEAYSEGAPEIIRVIVWKRLMKEGFEYCKGIVERGYKLCVQPARVSQYSHDEFVDMIKMFNELNPMAIYVVDSWGTMHSEELLRYLKLADENLKEGIGVGYHGHNNLMQTFDVAKDFCNQKLKRDLIVDASVYGIGRGAGNLSTEVFAKWANEKLGKEYGLQSITAIHDIYISEVYKERKWGVPMAYAIAARYNCNPNYADYFLNTLEIDDFLFEEVIKVLNEEDKIIFSRDAADDALYQIRKSKCSICIVVPTYNRARHIKAWIEEKIHSYYTYGVDVLFVDSSDNDETEKIIRNCKYKNVLYERYDDSKKRFHDTLDEKVEYSFSLVADRYDAVWPTRDRTMINIGMVYSQILRARYENADLVTFHCYYLEDDDIVEVFDYTDSNKYILEQFGNMTSLSSSLYFSKFLKEMLKDHGVKQDVNVGLWIPVAVFHLIANRSFKARFIKTNNLFINAQYDEPSFWLKNKSACNLWTERWPKMVENLPEKYNAEKEQLLTFVNFEIHPFCGLLLMHSRASGDFGFFKVIKCRKSLKKVARKYYAKILFVSLWPSNVVKCLLNPDIKYRPDIRFCRFLFREVFKIR